MKCLKIAICLLLLCLCISGVACSKDPCADGHLFEKWRTTVKANCATDGLKEAQCERCGAAGSEVLPATGEHRLSGFFVQTPATLFGKGERKQYCERCELCIDTREIPAIADSTVVERDASSVSLNLSACVIVYDSALQNDLYIATVTALKDALTRYTGASVEMRDYTQPPLSGTTCEIVVGTSGTSAVQAAQALLQGNGFAISASADQLLILGSNTPHTMHAVQYFTEVCVPGTGNGQTLSVSAKTVAKDATQSNIAATGEVYFDLVFSRELDNDPAHKHVKGDEKTNSRDYPCVAAEQLGKDFEAMLGLAQYSVAVRTDEMAAQHEILIGTFPNRPEVESFRATLEGHEYGILVHDGQVILTAHNDVALAECLASFKELLALCAESRNGKTVYAIPNGFCIRVGMDNGWITEFPKPLAEGIKLYNTQYNNDNSLQYYYIGEGVNATTYQTYCAQLLGAGYRLLCENSIEDSIFKTFVNDAADVTLYVAYNDYKHEAAYVKDDAYDVDFQKCIRVISAPLDSVTLPDAGLLTPNPTYHKVADSTITQLPFTGKAVGMGYVIRLEDGRFVVIDGGGVNTGGSEHDQIWNALNALYKDAYGADPTTASPIVIAAWINTHSHWDHYYAFQQMLKKYGKSGLLRMEYLLGNFPEESAIFAVSGSSLQMGKATTIPAMQANVTGGFQYVKVHTGQKFYLANATFEILMTYEDHNPRRICNSNDTCTIVRFSFANQDSAVGQAPVTAIFLADAFRFQSRYLCAMYGTYLQSDIVQLAHHGNIGCEKPVYEAIAAKVVLFPNAYGAFSTYTAGKSSTWNFKVDYFVVKEQESVQYVFVAEKLCLTFTLKPNGADFENVYDIADGKAPILFDGKTAIKKE